MSARRKFVKTLKIAERWFMFIWLAWHDTHTLTPATSISFPQMSRNLKIRELVNSIETRAPKWVCYNSAQKWYLSIQPNPDGQINTKLNGWIWPVGAILIYCSSRSFLSSSCKYILTSAHLLSFTHSTYRTPILTGELLASRYLWGNPWNRGGSQTDTALTLPFYNNL